MIATELKLNSCPCVIEPVPNSDRHFIVGCYELIDGDNRKGILYDIQSESIIKESSQLDGGVFDLKIRDDLIFVASSNGYLRIFCLNNLKNISSLKICDSFLTSVDIISSSTNCHQLVVSNSVGRLFIVSYERGQLEVIQDLVVNKFETSIWKVNVLKRDSCTLVFVGSDDGSLKIYNYSNRTIASKCVLENSDATAGLTAITSVINLSNAILVYTGSYDEHLRIYHFDPFEMKLTHFKSVHIPGSGVWKIRQLENYHLLIAGMYSGVHEVDLGGRLILSQSFEDESSIEKKQLIYDVIQDGSGKLLIASFYKQTLISCIK